MIESGGLILYNHQLWVQMVKGCPGNLVAIITEHSWWTHHTLGGNHSPMLSRHEYNATTIAISNVCQLYTQQLPSIHILYHTPKSDHIVLTHCNLTAQQVTGNPVGCFEIWCCHFLVWELPVINTWLFFTHTALIVSRLYRLPSYYFSSSFWKGQWPR